MMHPRLAELLHERLPENREDFLPFGLVIAACVAGAGLDLKGVSAVLALFLIAVTGLFAIRLRGRLRLLLFITAAMGYMLAFGRLSETGFFAFLARLSVYALPPLLLDLLMGFSRRRHRLVENVGLIHLYAPLALMTLGLLLVHVFHVGSGLESNQVASIAVPLIYWLYYAVILNFVALGLLYDLLGSGGSVRAQTGASFEEQGKFAHAGRAYAREGNFERSASMAQKAGDWIYAAEMYRQAGVYFQAAEMYFKAGRLEEALAMYHRAGSPQAAARVCLQLGLLEEAGQLLEKCGEFAEAVRVIEQAGKAASPELYMKAGQPARAASVYRERGNLQRAAEITEEELKDLAGAAQLFLDAGLNRKAGELFEASGQKEQAIEAYLRAPDTALNAAQACFETGNTDRARSILEQHATDDSDGMLLLARIYWQEQRIDDAIRILQRLRRQPEPPGIVNYLLGRCYLSKGYPEMAEAELRLASTLPIGAEETLESLYYLARALEDLGRRSEAMEAYFSVISRDFHFHDAESRYRHLKESESSSGPPIDPDLTYGDRPH